MPISPELLKILRCPRCRGPLAPAAGGGALACGRCGVAYPVVDDVPVLIAEEGAPLPPGPGERGPAS